MEKEFTFETAKKLLLARYGETETPLLEALDKLAGIGLILSPLAFGPAGLVAVAILGTKNELIKAGKYVVELLTKNSSPDASADYELLQSAYATICYAAFFSGLDECWPDFAEKLGVESPSELEARPIKEADKLVSSEEGNEEEDPEKVNSWIHEDIPFPHPTATFDQLLEDVDSLHEVMVSDFLHNLRGTRQIASMSREESSEFAELVTERLIKTGKEYFLAYYVELASSFDKFFLWSMLTSSEQTKTKLREQSQLIESQISQAEAIGGRIDVGLKEIQTKFEGIPKQLDDHKADKVIRSLQRLYSERMEEAIIQEEYCPREGGPALSFPQISEIFIPQAFKAIRKARDSRLEKEDVWEREKEWDTLGEYLLHVLRSPWSLELPTIVLGHPGSGKSLLTEVLAARLICPDFFPIRVPLRDVNAEADIQRQVEVWLCKFTGEEVTWTTLSDRLIELGTPPLVILDGYDELLQASGKVFANYVTKVREFQIREGRIGRPTRSIITSRLTLIDKADIPTGSTVFRLLEFNEKKRNSWRDVWNEKNTRYFKTTGVRPFSLPVHDQKIMDLAEQPLLLLMLALYDSEENDLVAQETLDQTVLYHNLLRKFIIRERTKGEAEADFKALNRNGQVALIEADLIRLGVAAIGMFNRRTLHIHDNQLNEDVIFFEVEQQLPNSPGTSLTQAEKLLGGFFFVHQSKSAVHQPDEVSEKSSSAFEFLHNTFGEFLAADFVLRQILTQTKEIHAQQNNPTLTGKLARSLMTPEAFPPEFYACLMYSSLHQRPVILSMMRNWSKHRIADEHSDLPEFLNCLDMIIENQLGRILGNSLLPRMLPREKAIPFQSFSQLGHLAIYTLNLVLIRTILCEDSYRFEENKYPLHEDGTKPWDQLMFLWRAWFSLESLSGLTAIFDAKRHEAAIELVPRKEFSTFSSDDRLLTIAEVGQTLSDGTTTAMAEFLMWSEFDKTRATLEDIQELESVAHLNLGLPMVVADFERRVASGTSLSPEDFIAGVEKALSGNARWTIHDVLRLIRLTPRLGTAGSRWREMNYAYEFLGDYLPWKGMLDAAHPADLAELILGVMRMGLDNERSGRSIGMLVLEHEKLGEIICTRPELEGLLTHVFSQTKEVNARAKIANALFSMEWNSLMTGGDPFQVLNLMRRIGSPDQQIEFLENFVNSVRNRAHYAPQFLIELSQFQGARSEKFRSFLEDQLSEYLDERLRNPWRESAIVILQLAIEAGKLDTAFKVATEIRENGGIRIRSKLDNRRYDVITTSFLRRLISAEDFGEFSRLAEMIYDEFG